jgi:hypothetical protein
MALRQLTEIGDRAAFLVLVQTSGYTSGISGAAIFMKAQFNDFRAGKDRMDEAAIGCIFACIQGGYLPGHGKN